MVLVGEGRWGPLLIDSYASILVMSTTITIRNLDEGVKQKLRRRAAEHGRSMEAEARELLRGALESEERASALKSVEELRQRLQGVRGAWKGRGATDELMALTRDED